MTEWWEQAYKGGPMVPVPGFPRPLYPPDSNKYGQGKGSADGPDVVAYKRTVARAQRWPWQTFDDTFSNGFSHGKSGNVGETGVAGVQRQQKIEDTGFIGEKTFNTLRSIRCPEGPNEGEMAMDAYSQSLLVEAWEMFGGEEPETPSKGTLRQAAYERALREIGVKEYPANSNQTPYSNWYGQIGPWCAMFCTWAYEQVGNSPSFARGVSYAYVPYIVSDSRAKLNGLSLTSSPVAGDMVCYDWHGDGVFDHVGLFEKWTGGSSFSAIEGNTSTSSDSDGGEVMRRQRDARSQSTLFVRVKEP